MVSFKEHRTLTFSLDPNQEGGPVFILTVLFIAKESLTVLPMGDLHVTCSYMEISLLSQRFGGKQFVGGLFTSSSLLVSGTVRVGTESLKSFSVRERQFQPRVTLRGIRRRERCFKMSVWT